MKRLSGYPNWFFWLIITATATATLTGLFMLPWVLEFKLQWDPGVELAPGLRLPAVVMHVFFGWLLLMLLGALWHSHIRAGWRKRNNHHSGLLMSFSLLLLALSGIGLYYLGSEQGQLFASLLHSSLGLTLFSGFLWHYYHGRRLRLAQGHRRHHSHRRGR
ncbi:hypothetical protein LZP73_09130 [Shewanella sp. AS16]|uniref:hypothetical protein n=1 Tax=Shewanella sp. AS16 TaxID=2907625 RepID=UPI001F25DADD|nr:hypothetical protein [Shewanella sp. AS16]MCE9686374.1 hypothetical protein [Shewanella sp. AS16]